MVIDRRKAIVFGAAAALRLLLFLSFPTLPEFLTGRVEISTPVTSFKRCMSLMGTYSGYEKPVLIPWGRKVQEGLFLYTHDLSPYDGGVFYQASPNL